MDFTQPHFIFTTENPMYQPKITPPSVDQVIEWLKLQGEDAQEVAGHYGSPERSILVKNPKNVAGLHQLAQDSGQESAIYSNNGNHELRYLNGDKKGKVLRGRGTEVFAQAPADFYTTVTDEQGDKVHFRHNLNEEEHYGKHPHGYDWHDGHTLHNDGIPELKKDESHPHNEAHGPSGNDQAGGNTSGKFHEIMGNFGTIDPSKTTNLKFYNGIENHHDKIDNHIKNAGYQVYYAGGKYGKPDLANKNYNTKHLMVYDPSPDSGASFQDENFTAAWRKAHEMAHADTLPALNQKYGEGRRLGKLGVRSPREMKRAVEWEDMAVKRQRDIMKNLGYNISDEDFNKERNVVLGDATHRAVTGLFTDPHEMGFYPHDKHIPLDHALSIIDKHAKNLGLEHDDDTLAAKRQRLGKSEELFKSPMPYSMYNKDRASINPLPDLAHDDDYVHLKTVNLPNGLEYRKFKKRKSLPESQRLVHAIYDPAQKYEPLAYMETAHEEDAAAKNGYHPHAIQWSEVQPDHRGKGLGRQLYLATLIHGTGRLTSGENISPEANKAWESFKNYPGFHGKIAYYPKSNNELIARPSLAQEASERHRVAVKDATKLDYNKMFPPINKALTKSEIEFNDILEKAIDDKAWNRIVKGHNKAVEAGSSVVDDVGHLNYFNSSHKDYKKKVLDHPEIAPADKHNPDLGVSPKLIHTIPSNNDDHDTKYMAKPYHAPVERWAAKWSKHPIKGWASLTTNKLFHAADMGDLVEELGGHIHKGVPLVVSKFNPEAQDTYLDPRLNMKDMAKIGIMDFITNNQDRHRGNMMHINSTPLAIDHERNFNYFEPKPGFAPGNITPQHALNQFDASITRDIRSNGDIINDDLVDWWQKTGHNIKNEMQKNLKFIKDPKVKSHIEDNFNKRWDWVHNKMQDDPNILFSNNFPGVKNTPYVKERKKKV